MIYSNGLSGRNRIINTEFVRIHGTIFHAIKIEVLEIECREAHEIEKPSEGLYKAFQFVR